MAFFTQAIRDGTLDKNLKMSEEELRNAIIARVLESNAWERHRMQHKDAKISTISEDGGFSQIEKISGKKQEEEPAISYDSHTKSFVAGCNCGKERFVFNIKDDTVESEHATIKIKEMDSYKRRDDTEKDNPYGKNSGNGIGYNNSSYGDSGNNYRNNPSSSYRSPM